jgi:hypothetical protein
MSEGETIPAVPRRKSRAKKIIFSLIGVIAVGITTGQVWYHYTFPYGWSHCCAKGLMFALEEYAQEHGGRYPFGGDSPEASLGLLYSNYVDANVLRGKTVSLQTVERALAKNHKLDPDSCGWHYVEGLTLSDDPQIAVVWDKIGLGHNGQHLKNGGHEVIFVSGSELVISGPSWPKFLKEQQELLAHRNPKAIQGLPELTARIHLPGGEVLTNYDGFYELKTVDASGEGTENSSHMDLLWYHVYPEGDGPMTWTLTLPDRKLRSKPVTFTVTNGQASPDSITFEMEAY